MNEPEKTVSPEAAARLQRMFENIYSQTPYFQSMPCTVEKLDVAASESALISAVTPAITGALPPAASWRRSAIPSWAWPAGPWASR